jgi:hypothetical protein
MIVVTIVSIADVLAAFKGGMLFHAIHLSRVDAKSGGPIC